MIAVHFPAMQYSVSYVFLKCNIVWKLLVTNRKKQINVDFRLFLNDFEQIVNQGELSSDYVSLEQTNDDVYNHLWMILVDNFKLIVSLKILFSCGI